MFCMSITQAWERSVFVKLAFLSKCFHSFPRWPPLVSCFINQIETRISFLKDLFIFLFYVYASFTCMYVCIPFMYCLSRSEEGVVAPELESRTLWTRILVCVSCPSTGLRLNNRTMCSPTVLEDLRQLWLHLSAVEAGFLSIVVTSLSLLVCHHILFNFILKTPGKLA